MKKYFIACRALDFKIVIIDSCQNTVVKRKVVI